MIFIGLLFVLPTTVSAMSIEYKILTNEIPPTNEDTVIGYYTIDTSNFIILPDSNVTIIGVSIVDQYDYFDIELVNVDYSQLSLPYTVTDEISHVFVNISTLYGLTKSNHQETLTIFYTEDGEPKNQSIDLMFIVPEYPDYLIDKLNTTIDIDVGEDSSYSLFQINNTGNTFFYLDVEYSTDTEDILDYIDYPTELKVFNNLNNEFNINTHIPNNYATGTYVINFTISNALKEFTHELTLNIIDSLSPTLETITVVDTMLTLDNLITIIAKDNINVTTVSINITDIYEDTYTTVENNETVTKTELISEYIETVVMTPINDTDTWTYNYRDTNKVKTVQLNITATDNYNNSVSELVSFDVAQLDSISYNATIEFDKRKVGFGSEHVAFNLDYNTEAYVTLVEIKPVGINYSLYVIDPAGNKDYIDQDNPTKTIKILKKGEYKLRLTSDYIGEVHGTLYIKPPTEHVTLEPFIFTGIFVNYTVPAEQYEYKSISVEENCNWIDTGVYEDSYYDCLVKRFPPNVDPAKWDSGYTAEQLQELRNEHTKKIDNKDGQIRFRNYIILFFIVIAGLCAFIINYYANNKDSLLVLPVDD